MNRYRSHVLVVPEDEATRQLADGFVLHHSVITTRVRIVPPVGGWSNVLGKFTEEYVPYLRQFEAAHLVMVIDFDCDYSRRRQDFAASIPDDLKARVFVVGVRDTPEVARSILKDSFENIGRRLAEDCDGATKRLWEHDEFKHNEPDRMRLLEVVRPILFDSTRQDPGAVL